MRHVSTPGFPGADHHPVLMDGGTYDNTGLPALDDKAYRDVFLVAMNAGGLLRPGAYGRVPVIRERRDIQPAAGEAVRIFMRLRRQHNANA